VPSVEYNGVLPIRTMTHLYETADLDAAIEESRSRPVLLFKHSRNCGVSCGALEELQAHVQQADGTAAYTMVTVQSHRLVSDQVAKRLGIRHETPQAILLRDGLPVWSASHFGITSDALAKHIE
jgi:bacillithiol system protein YtxJ